MKRFTTVTEGSFQTARYKVVQVPVRIKSYLLEPAVITDGIAEGSGNFYTFESRPNGDFDNPRSEHSVHKWNAQEPLWTTVTHPQDYRYWSWNIAADSAGNVYLAGFEDTGVFINVQRKNFPAELYKFDPSGKRLWMTQIPVLMGEERARVEKMVVVDGKVMTLPRTTQSLTIPCYRARP